MPDNLYDMLVTEFLTQRKDNQVAPVNYKVNKNLVQTSDSRTDGEEDVLDIVHTVSRKVSMKKILVNVSSTHMDNVSFHFEKSVQK